MEVCGQVVPLFKQYPRTKYSEIFDLTNPILPIRSESSSDAAAPALSNHNDVHVDIIIDTTRYGFVEDGVMSFLAASQWTSYDNKFTAGFWARDMYRNGKAIDNRKSRRSNKPLKNPRFYIPTFRTHATIHT